MPRYKDRPTQFGKHIGFYHPDDWVAKFEYELDKDYGTGENFSSWYYAQTKSTVSLEYQPGMGYRTVTYKKSDADILESLMLEYLKLDPQYNAKKQLSAEEFQAIKKIWDNKKFIPANELPSETAPTRAVTGPSTGNRGPRVLGLLLFIGLVVGIAVGVGVGIAIGGPVGAVVGAMIGFVVGPVVGGYIGNRLDKGRLKSVISAREQALEQYEKSTSLTTHTNIPDSVPKPTVGEKVTVSDPKNLNPQFNNFQKQQEPPKANGESVVPTPTQPLPPKKKS